MSRKISDLYEEFQPKVKKFLTEANSLTFPWKTFITNGYRSFEEQNALYEKGRTKSGRIVTNAIAGHSWHNFGLAVDIAFQKDGKLSYANTHYNKIVPIAKRLGLTWGGDWQFVDKPHFEWHPRLSLSQARAGKRPKGGSVSPTEDKLTKMRLERDKNWKLYVKERDKVDGQEKENDRLREEIRNLNGDIKRNVSLAENKVKEYKAFVSDLGETYGIEHTTQAIKAEAVAHIEDKHQVALANSRAADAVARLKECERGIKKEVQSVEEVQSDAPKTLKGVVGALRRFYIQRKEVNMAGKKKWSLNGYKTYVIAGLVAAVVVAGQLGWLSTELANVLLGLLGAGSLVTLRHAVKKAE